MLLLTKGVAILSASDYIKHIAPERLQNLDGLFEALQVIDYLHQKKPGVY